MTNARARLTELCLIAALTLASGLAAAGAPNDRRDHSYVYLSKGDSITMSGDSKDVVRARSFRQGNGPLLWFREGGQDYVIRDADTLAQLEAIWKPSRELDLEESKLDRQHDELERKHDQLETRRDQLETRREALSDRESELADREAEDSTSAATRAELAKQRRELQRQRDALTSEMRALEPPMAELRTQMEPLQRQIRALGAKQEIASRNEDAEMWKLCRRAIASGKATPAR